MAVTRDTRDSARAALARSIYPAVLWVFCAAGFGSTGKTVAQAQPDAALRAVPPRSWVVEAANNELIVLHHPNSYLRYSMHIVDERRDMTRDVIESQEGAVARMILRDEKALTAEEDKAERHRLTDMISHPSEFSKHMKNDATGRKIADDLIRLMPDAMIYTYAPGQPQIPGQAGPQIVLDYAPNPKFKPPTITADALTGLKGRAWIDAKTKYVVRMEGEVFRPVNLGWGVVAHIYPGGKLLLEQTDAGNGRWVFTHFTEDISVRALMVKTVNVHAKVDASDFQVLPGPMTYQDAIRLLLSTPLPTK